MIHANQKKSAANGVVVAASLLPPSFMHLLDTGGQSVTPYAALLEQHCGCNDSSGGGGAMRPGGGGSHTAADYYTWGDDEAPWGPTEPPASTLLLGNGNGDGEEDGDGDEQDWLRTDTGDPITAPIARNRYRFLRKYYAMVLKGLRALAGGVRVGGGSVDDNTTTQSSAVTCAQHIHTVTGSAGHMFDFSHFDFDAPSIYTGETFLSVVCAGSEGLAWWPEDSEAVRRRNAELRHLAEVRHIRIFARLLLSVGCSTDVDLGPIFFPPRFAASPSPSFSVTAGDDGADVLDVVATPSSVRRGLGNSPLHWACFRGDWGLARLLLDVGGADVYARNALGETPLQVGIVEAKFDFYPLESLAGGVEDEVEYDEHDGAGNGDPSDGDAEADDAASQPPPHQQRVHSAEIRRHGIYNSYYYVLSSNMALAEAFGDGGFGHGEGRGNKEGSCLPRQQQQPIANSTCTLSDGPMRAVPVVRFAPSLPASRRLQQQSSFSVVDSSRGLGRGQSSRTPSTPPSPPFPTAPPPFLLLLNIHNYCGHALLHSAVHTGRPGVVEWLLRCGASPSARAGVGSGGCSGDCGGGGRVDADVDFTVYSSSFRQSPLQVCKARQRLADVRQMLLRGGGARPPPSPPQMPAAAASPLLPSSQEFPTCCWRRHHGGGAEEEEEWAMGVVDDPLFIIGIRGASAGTGGGGGRAASALHPTAERYRRMVHSSSSNGGGNSSSPLAVGHSTSEEDEQKERWGRIQTEFCTTLLSGERRLLAGDGGAATLFHMIFSQRAHASAELWVRHIRTMRGVATSGGSSSCVGGEGSAARRSRCSSYCGGDGSSFLDSPSSSSSSSTSSSSTAPPPRRRRRRRRFADPSLPNGDGNTAAHCLVGYADASQPLMLLLLPLLFDCRHRCYCRRRCYAPAADATNTRGGVSGSGGGSVVDVFVAKAARSANPDPWGVGGGWAADAVGPDGAPLNGGASPVWELVLGDGRVGCCSDDDDGVDADGGADGAASKDGKTSCAEGGEGEGEGAATGDPSAAVDADAPPSSLTIPAPAPPAHRRQPWCVPLTYAVRPREHGRGALHRQVGGGDCQCTAGRGARRRGEGPVGGERGPSAGRDNQRNHRHRSGHANIPTTFIDVNAQNALGNTVLHIAAAHGAVEFIRNWLTMFPPVLLPAVKRRRRSGAATTIVGDGFADGDAKEVEGDDAFVFVVSPPPAVPLPCRSQQHVAINCTNTAGMTAFHVAVLTGQVAAAELLMDLCPPPLPSSASFAIPSSSTPFESNGGGTASSSLSPATSHHHHQSRSRSGPSSCMYHTVDGHGRSALYTLVRSGALSLLLLNDHHSLVAPSHHAAASGKASIYSSSLSAAAAAASGTVSTAGRICRALFSQQHHLDDCGDSHHDGVKCSVPPLAMSTPLLDFDVGNDFGATFATASPSPSPLPPLQYGGRNILHALFAEPLRPFECYSVRTGLSMRMSIVAATRPPASSSSSSGGSSPLHNTVTGASASASAAVMGRALGVILYWAREEEETLTLAASTSLHKVGSATQHGGGRGGVRAAPYVSLPARLLSQQDARGCTPLHLAMLHQPLDVVKAVIEAMRGATAPPPPPPPKATTPPTHRQQEEGGGASGSHNRTTISDDSNDHNSDINNDDSDGFATNVNEEAIADAFEAVDHAGRTVLDLAKAHGYPNKLLKEMKALMR